MTEAAKKRTAGLFSGGEQWIRALAERLRLSGRFLRRLSAERKYLMEERNFASYALLKRELFRVLKNTAPRRGGGYLRVGLSDPASTGKLAEAAALLYPVYGEHFQVYPEFEEEVLEGEINAKGHISVAVLLWSAFRLFKDKNLRRIYRHFAREEHREGAGAHASSGRARRQTETDGKGDRVCLK